MSTSFDQRLIEVFAELVRGVAGGEHVTQALELLARRSTDLLRVTSAGIIVADPRGGHRVLAASDEQAELAELFQSFEEEGPAVDVLASGRELTVDLAQADERWPIFAPAARQVGIGWVHALPIFLDSAVVGALNLFRAEPGGDLPDHALGQALCGLISIVLAQERPARRAERLAERVQQILNERGRIEQVKGILAVHMDTTPARAYAVLAHYARTRDVRVVEVATDVIEGRAEPAAMLAAWRQGQDGHAP